MHVQAMARVRLDIRLELVRLGERLPAHFRNRLGHTTGIRAIATAEGNVLVTRDDQDRASKGTLHRGAVHSKQLANGNRLLVLLRKLEHLGVEVRRRKKEDLVGADV